MELDARKITILKTIIQTYLETGEPVGSRTISRSSDLKLSSATIRNEMSDLEQMGYILQPHTSSGRIPSDKGYRFYVDEIVKEKDAALKERDAEKAELAEVTEEKQSENSLMISRVDRLEDLLKQMARILAVSTNYAAMISGPQYNRTKLKFVQLSRVETGKLLIVTVLEGNIIKNSMVDTAETLDDQELLNLNILLNNNLTGLTMEQINLDVISKMKQQAGEQREVVDMVLNEIAEAIRTNEEDLNIYTEGATNIFKYPELSDRQQASELLHTFEKKDELKEFLAESAAMEEAASEGKKNGIQVYIGQENQVQSMKDCSVVTANYDLGNGLRGTVGIVGPKRMDYEKVVGTLRTLMSQLQNTFNDKKNGSGTG
ncbi:heat-inducible transcriptional repressor HrcA [[Clostridium] aminophilum]|uniref:Heat-inducible transcription repressor HrcA n=1 Tax=[Clostridium] aminophilum TaxID=1526 RepID=A0A1I0ER31_9FIRM|nr:heat-inducible transcriptional repressor HrcA [[Clostridium] aminophilum]MDD6196908.1 heat-inducible transcriptional repressor HrcA [[Clostridium] aminophilum]SET47781.1 heat-inducible transcription repressor HrcA [[Clostridium] aminophilum]